MPSLTLTLKLLEFGFGMNDPRGNHFFPLAFRRSLWERKH